MRILEAKNYEEMSALAAGIIGAQVLLQPRCVLGLATGSSPIGTYEKLVEAHRAGRLDFSQVRTVNLDEYCGLSGDNPQSYRYFMEKHLFSQVNLPQGSTHLPNGTAPAWICSCWALATTATSALTSPAKASPRRCTRWS